MASDPRLAAVVELVMQKLDAENARQLADALGMTDIDRERRVQRWLVGESTPRFVYTMMMLSRAGLLTPEADRAWRSKEVPDPLRAAGEAAEKARRDVARVGRAAQAQRKKGTG